jgi:hypothetical protein
MTITRIAQIAAVLSATMLSACGGPGGEIGIRESGASSSTRGASQISADFYGKKLFADEACQPMLTRMLL